MVTPTAGRDPDDPGLLGPLRAKSFLSEAQRKAIHLCFILLPLELLYEWLPWPRGRGEWRLVLITCVAIAMAIDLIRIHDHRVKRFFRKLLGEMIRDHEQVSLLGSTYLLLASLLAIGLFPTPIAATAIGFTVLGDASAAIVGRGWGRTRVFSKSLEGALAGLAACLVWGSYLAATGRVPWSVAIAGALVASLIELLPIPLDDNLGITLFSGYAMMLLGGST